MEITQEEIYNRFPWSKPVDLEFDNSDGFFCDVMPWSFNQAQLELIHKMLREVESWFFLRNEPIEIVIIEFKEVLGHVIVEKVCRHTEVDKIFEKYQAIYLGEQLQWCIYLGKAF